jgi:hypothetical protein
MGFGYRHWPFLRSGGRLLCHLQGQRQLRLPRGVPGIGRGAVGPFTWGQSQRVLLTGRFTRTEATAPALFPSASGLGVAT